MDHHNNSNNAARPGGGPQAGATRRGFLKAAALAGAGFWVAGREPWARAADEARPTTSPGDKLNLGIIGVAGRAESSMNEENNAVASQNIVAICDVDSAHLAKAAERFPKAAAYADFRKLLDRNDLDAVMISTPDHTHAAATLWALNTNRHVYCEKPLTHTVEEARRVALAAVKNKRVTQLGTQIHAGGNYRRVVELVQSGAIGKVSQVHVFCDKSWSGGNLPTKADPVPKDLDYDLWLGPVPPRPFHRDYHPASWRKWWAFGNGTLGDMACHYMDLPFWALRLRHPTKIAADGPPVDPDGCPHGLTVHYEFPARPATAADGKSAEAGALPPVKLSWYDGGKRPAAFDEWGLTKDQANGVMFLGDKGRLFSDYGGHKLYPPADFADFHPPKPSIPDSIGHHREWIEACKKDDPSATTCPFDYGGALTEAVLLGNVAYRTGKPLEWDAENLKATNAPEAEEFIRARYREGWNL